MSQYVEKYQELHHSMNVLLLKMFLYNSSLCHRLRYSLKSAHEYYRERYTVQ